MDTAAKDFEQERKKIQRRVFSSIAHDLRTPLACILGSLQMLDQMNEKISNEQRDALVKIALEQAHCLDVLVSEMLDKAKPE